MTYRMMALGTMMSASLAAPLVAPTTAHAQDSPGKDRDQAGYVTLVRPREHERVLFNVGVGYTPFGRHYHDEVEARTRDGRSTEVNVDYALGYSLNIEAGAVVMLNSRWGVGLTVLKHRFEDGEATTTLERFREFSEVTGAMRKETAANLELNYVLYRSEGQQDPFDPYTDRATGYVVRVFGGPTHYRAEQDVITFRPTGVGLEEPIKHEGTGWGYHVGLDMAMYTSIPGLGGGGVGFGGTFRWGGGSVKLPGLDEPSNRPAGGFNMGYTIRFRL